ncbi:hypothetical protein [Pseudomonas sp. 3A(2025)]
MHLPDTFDVQNAYAKTVLSMQRMHRRYSANALAASAAYTRNSRFDFPW